MGLFGMKKAKNFAQRIKEVADQAGLKVVEANEDLVVAMFALPEGRKQKVVMMPVGDLLGSTVFVVCSMSQQIDGDLDAQMANRLLRENANHKVGYWGIIDLGEGQFVGCHHSLVLETLDPKELDIIVRTVAMEADKLEMELTGGDKF
jgi:hypothetical protein